jgi:hypothetical protein
MSIRSSHFGLDLLFRFGDDGQWQAPHPKGIHPRHKGAVLATARLHYSGISYYLLLVTAHRPSPQNGLNRASNLPSRNGIDYKGHLCQHIREGERATGWLRRPFSPVKELDPQDGRAKAGPYSSYDTVFHVPLSLP